VLSHMLGATAAVNRGVRRADYFVIRYTSVPAILVEMGYLSHPIEGLNLRDTNYLDRIGYGIARGVLEYLENDHPLEWGFEQNFLVYGYGLHFFWPR